MTCALVKLWSRFPNRLHLGLGSMDRSDFLPHSDTLFSALGNAFLLLYGEKELLEFLDGLQISSVFPGIRLGERDLLFFPVPLSVVHAANSSDLLLRKKVKRVRFASLEAFRAVMGGFNPQKHAFVVNLLDEKRFALWNSQYLVTRSEMDLLQDEAIRIGMALEPHVTVHRQDNRSQDLYFEEDAWVHGSSSVRPFLFFLVSGGGAFLEPVLRLFIEEGLGGERFQGKGRFDAFETEPFELPQEGKYLILLSLAKPRREEMSHLLVYDLIRRGGFIFRGEPLGVRKRTLYKLVEGSVVRLPFVGENVDVSPFAGQPVISYGKALGFAVPGEGVG
jgi:CRISPR-associated protein Csm4